MLQHVEAGNLLPPLVVLSILAKDPSLQLSTVKGYIGRQLTAESGHIQQDKAQIAKYQQDTAQMRTEIKELRTQVRHELLVPGPAFARAQGHTLRGLLGVCQVSFPLSVQMVWGKQVNRRKLAWHNSAPSVDQSLPAMTAARPVESSAVQMVRVLKSCSDSEALVGA